MVGIKRMTGKILIRITSHDKYTDSGQWFQLVDKRWIFLITGIHLRTADYYPKIKWVL